MERPRLFHHDIKCVIIISQIFGLLPIKKFTSENSDDLVFTWRSKEVFLSVSIITGSIFTTVMSFCQIIKNGSSLQRFRSFMFNANSAVSGIIFFKLARKWPLLMEKWSKVELSLENYGNNNRYQKRKFVVIISVIMSAAIVEHILSVLHVSQIPNENSNKLEAYFLTNYPHLFNFFEFSIPLAIFATVMNICNVFSWNFLDAFLIIISIALTEKFHQVNDEVVSTFRLKIHIQQHWMKLREDYNKISILCKIVNKEIADLILVSFATNMFFIMSQLYWSLNQHKTTTIESIYFCFSFGLLVLRTVAVTLYASNINDESKKSMSYLFSLNSNTYNSEIERLAYQIHCQPVALTGHDFFKITRGLLFSMAGAIVTYELFLVQSNIVASY